MQARPRRWAAICIVAVAINSVDSSLSRATAGARGIIIALAAGVLDVAKFGAPWDQSVVFCVLDTVVEDSPIIGSLFAPCGPTVSPGLCSPYEPISSQMAIAPGTSDASSVTESSSMHRPILS